jgi:cell division protease FtsH
MRLKGNGRCYPRVVAPVRTSAKRRQSKDPRTRTAYHEAGHAVLSLAIANAPEVVSIRVSERTAGRIIARPSARSTTRIQVHLAGHAAEHLLTGRRSPGLSEEVGFAIVASWDPELRADFADLEDRDGACAVYELLRVGAFENDDDIKRAIDRFYDATRESLSAVWPSVERVAMALLEREELDRDALDELLAESELFMPIFAIQNAYGFMQLRAPLARPANAPPST